MAEAEPTTWQWVELVVGGGVAPIFTGVSVGVAVGWIERMARRQEAVRDAFWSPQHGLATALWRLDESYRKVLSAGDGEALRLELAERRAAVEMLQLWHEAHLRPRPKVRKAINVYMQMVSELAEPGPEASTPGIAERRMRQRAAYMAVLHTMQQTLNPPYIERWTLVKLWLYDRGWRWWPIPRQAPKGSADT